MMIRYVNDENCGSKRKVYELRMPECAEFVNYLEVETILQSGQSSAIESIFEPIGCDDALSETRSGRQFDPFRLFNSGHIII